MDSYVKNEQITVSYEIKSTKAFRINYKKKIGKSENERKEIMQHLLEFCVVSEWK